MMVTAEDGVVMQVIATHDDMITKREMFEKSPLFVNNFAIFLSFFSEPRK